MEQLVQVKERGAGRRICFFLVSSYNLDSRIVSNTVEIKIKVAKYFPLNVTTFSVNSYDYQKKPGSLLTFSLLRPSLPHIHYPSVISDLLDNNLPSIEYLVCSGNYCFLPTYRPVDRSVHVLDHADIARAVCATRCARAGKAVVCVGVGCTDGGREFGCGGVGPDSRVL